MPPLPPPRPSRARTASPPPRWALAALLACAATRGSDAAPKITIQSLPHFEQLRCLESGGHWELRGRLLDDVGEPLAAVPIELERGGKPFAAPPCGGHGARGRGGALHTDAAGEVCVWLAESPSRGSLTVLFRGDALHLLAQGEVALEPAAGELQLGFDAPSLELNLNQPEQQLTLQLSGDSASASRLPEIELQLEDAGRLRPIATQGWSRSGNALSFRVASRDLGAPGPARLLAQLKDTARAPVLAEAVALRSATVELERGGVTLGPDAAELPIVAVSRAGVPSSGWVDVSLAGQSLASSPLVSGVATLRAALAAGSATSLLVSYHSDDPWWLPGAPLAIDLAGTTEREPARWPWLALLAPVGYVCVRALERPGVRKPRRSAARPPLRAAPPALRLGEAAPSGWSGMLTDAHDGRPIAGARVTASLPSLLQDARGPSTVSDEHGRYALPALREPIPEGARLLVSARLHVDLQRPLPPQGRADLSLTSRRRALLGRLVRWARAAGPPWHRSAEPTPGEIKNVALRRGDTDTARWAEGVQAAAFDHSDVDQRREAEVQAGEPGWQQAGPPEGRSTDRTN